MRDSFIFYRSFYEAIKELPDANQLEIYNAIMEYSLNFNTLDITGISKTILRLIEPQLEANNKRYTNGSTPKRKQNESKEESEDKQNESKEEANKNNNKNENNNKNKYIADFDSWYSVYPRKEGKTRATAWFKKNVTSKEIYTELITARDNYIKSTKGKDKQYLKHVDTFCNNYKDYLDSELKSETFYHPDVKSITEEDRRIWNEQNKIW